MSAPLTRDFAHLKKIGTTLLRPRAVTFKSTYAPDPDSFARLELLPIRSLALPQPPKFTLTLGRRIYENLTAILTLRSGAYAIGPWGASAVQPVSDSTLSVGLQHTNGLAVEVTSGVFTQQLSGGWGTTVLSGFKIGLNGVVTSTGAMSVGWNVDRRITENVKTGLGLDVGVNGAMTFKIRRASSPPDPLKRAPADLHHLVSAVQDHAIGTKDLTADHCLNFVRPGLVLDANSRSRIRHHYDELLLARAAPTEEALCVCPGLESFAAGHAGALLTTLRCRQETERAAERTRGLHQRKTGRSIASAGARSRVRGETSPRRGSEEWQVPAPLSSSRHVSSSQTLTPSGLIIDEAVYGVLEAVDERVESDFERRWFNVTRECRIDYSRAFSAVLMVTSSPNARDSMLQSRCKLSFLPNHRSSSFRPGAPSRPCSGSTTVRSAKRSSCV